MHSINTRPAFSRIYVIISQTSKNGWLIFQKINTKNTPAEIEEKHPFGYMYMVDRVPLPCNPMPLFEIASLTIGLSALRR